jgi:hypothetical protein
VPSPCIVRIRTFDQIRTRELAFELTDRLNRPSWPRVDIAVTDDILACRATTWEPLLRVRIEEALDDLLGVVWRDSLHWV